MRRFQSRVTALRDLRQRREEEALQVHSRALQERQTAEDRLQASIGALQRHQLEIQAQLNSGCPAASLARQDGYRLMLEEHCREGRRRVADACAATEASLKAVLLSRREREVVERFCTREREDHQREQLREEQKNLDEMALRRRGVDASFQTTIQSP